MTRQTTTQQNTTRHHRHIYTVTHSETLKTCVFAASTLYMGHLRDALRESGRVGKDNKGESWDTYLFLFCRPAPTSMANAGADHDCLAGLAAPVTAGLSQVSDINTLLYAV